MRGPDSEPREPDEPEAQEPILAIPCPCCQGEDEAFGRRCCLTLVAVMTKELGAFLGTPPPPFNGVTGWMNDGDEAFNLPGCWRCGDAGVVPCSENTEEEL